MISALLLPLALLAHPSSAAPTELIPAIAQDPKPAAAFDHTHAAWSAILAAHVSDGRVDYKTLHKDTSALGAYLRSLEVVKPADFAKWDRKQQLAFWINAYNAYTLKRVLHSYPFEKVDELGDEKKGPWDERTIYLGALVPEINTERVSLNEIENKILRPKFKDPRIHAAVNCAAESCPPLRAEAYTADKLDKQLDEQVKAWLANPKLNSFDAAKKELKLSKIFDWYAQDFVEDAGSIESWISRYVGKDAKWIASPDAKKSFLEYSWKLNDKRAQ
jgi:hypothetical protein